MSDPMCILCRTCDKDAYGPNGMYQDELQTWYEIRHELAALRSVWCSFFQSAPKIDHDDNGNFTNFLCEHKDHDICITNPYPDHNTGMPEVFEFKKAEIKPKSPIRHFRELRDRQGFKSDILETDAAPRLYHQIVKERACMKASFYGPATFANTPPYESIRFVFEKEELVLLRTYKEK